MGSGQTVRDPDVDKGAMEENRPTDPGRGNPDAPGLDDNGLPDDPVAITEDVVGANEDETEG